MMVSFEAMLSAGVEAIDVAVVAQTHRNNGRQSNWSPAHLSTSVQLLLLADLELGFGVNLVTWAARARASGLNLVFALERSGVNAQAGERNGLVLLAGHRDGGAGHKSGEGDGDRVTGLSEQHHCWAEVLARMTVAMAMALVGVAFVAARTRRRT